MGAKRAIRRCLVVPAGRIPAGGAPTWGALAARYERCRRRVARHVRRRLEGEEAAAEVVAETLERNVDLLLAEHGELEELRRLRETADRRIAARAAAR